MNAVLPTIRRAEFVGDSDTPSLRQDCECEHKACVCGPRRFSDDTRLPDGFGLELVPWVGDEWSGLDEIN